MIKRFIRWVLPKYHYDSYPLQLINDYYRYNKYPFKIVAWVYYDSAHSQGIYAVIKQKTKRWFE